MRFFEQFPLNRSQMQIWAPRVNQITINEAKSKNAANPLFWEVYFETEESEREDLLLTWVDPTPPSEISINDNSTHWYPKNMFLAVMMEAKKVPGSPQVTHLTKEHYKEMIRFEQWLYTLKFTGEIPGIPTGNNSYSEYPNQWLLYPEKPEYLTWHDLCMRENDVNVSLWPEDIEIPDSCRRNPENCDIKPEVM